MNFLVRTTIHSSHTTLSKRDSGPKNAATVVGSHRAWSQIKLHECYWGSKASFGDLYYPIARDAGNIGDLKFWKFCFRSQIGHVELAIHDTIVKKL